MKRSKKLNSETLQIKYFRPEHMAQPGNEADVDILTLDLSLPYDLSNDAVAAALLGVEEHLFKGLNIEVPQQYQAMFTKARHNLELTKKNITNAQGAVPKIEVVGG